MPTSKVLAAILAMAIAPATQTHTAKAFVPGSNIQVAPPVLLVAGAVTLDVPELVDPGASVVVAISGSQPGGRIELWGPITQSAQGNRIDSTADASGSARLNAPDKPGSYELRYISASNAMLARATLEVAATPIVLSAPRGLIAGIDSEIEWRGPAAPGDMIQIFDSATGAVIAEAPATGLAGAANLAILRGPERTGDYQIRYWSDARQAALRSLPVTVEAGNAWLRTPIEVVVGEIFAVQWEGPTDANNVYRIVNPVTGVIVTSLTGSGAGSANLEAPAKPGAYRVQLVDPATGFILADLPLDVDPK